MEVFTQLSLPFFRCRNGTLVEQGPHVSSRRPSAANVDVEPQPQQGLGQRAAAPNECQYGRHLHLQLSLLFASSITRICFLSSLASLILYTIIRCDTSRRATDMRFSFLILDYVRDRFCVSLNARCTLGIRQQVVYILTMVTSAFMPAQFLTGVFG